MSQRTDRLDSQIRAELMDLIQREMKDPRIGFATVTAVRISGDLRHARVLVSVLGSDDERAETMTGLESATPHLRAELGRQVRLKYLPELHFELDDAGDRAARVEALLKQVSSGEGAP